jgi:hypothetical protein
MIVSCIIDLGAGLKLHWVETEPDKVTLIDGYCDNNGYERTVWSLDDLTETVKEFCSHRDKVKALQK